MHSAKEFRDNADECVGWARTAHSDRERQIFLQMAKTWLEAARASEVNTNAQEEAATSSASAVAGCERSDLAGAA
jgi:hypothetical protein